MTRRKNRVCRFDGGDRMLMAPPSNDPKARRLFHCRGGGVSGDTSLGGGKRGKKNATTFCWRLYVSSLYGLKCSARTRGWREAGVYTAAELPPYICACATRPHFHMLMEKRTRTTATLLSARGLRRRVF